LGAIPGLSLSKAGQTFRLSEDCFLSLCLLGESFAKGKGKAKVISPKEEKYK